MAGLKDLGFGHLWDKIKAILSAIGNFLASFFQAETGVYDNVVRIFDAIETTKRSIEDGSERLRNFQFNIQWKTRVIHVPTAIDRFRDLYIRLFTDFRAKIETISNPIFAFKTTFSPGGNFDPSDHVSGLAKTTVKIEAMARLVSEIADAFDQIADWASAFDQLIVDIETLEDAFLQQGNPRIFEKKSGSFRIRG